MDRAVPEYRSSQQKRGPAHENKVLSLHLDQPLVLGHTPMRFCDIILGAHNPLLHHFLARWCKCESPTTSPTLTPTTTPTLVPTTSPTPIPCVNPPGSCNECVNDFDTLNIRTQAGQSTSLCNVPIPVSETMGLPGRCRRHDLVLRNVFWLQASVGT